MVDIFGMNGTKWKSMTHWDGFFFSFVIPGNMGFMENVGKIVGLSKCRNKFMKYLLKTNPNTHKYFILLIIRKFKIYWEYPQCSPYG